MLINDVTKRYHISARTLRYYEEIELLEPIRTDNGRRMYDDIQIKKLEEILLYKSLGFKLESIKGILNQTYTIKEILYKHLHELDKSILEQRYQREVLLSVLNTYGSDNINKHNLDAFLQEQIYLKDERWLNMTKNNITIDIGQSLLPIALRENTPNLLTAIGELRSSFENIYGHSFDKIRLKDVTTIEDFEFQILINDDIQTKMDLNGLSNEQQIDTILTHLKAMILKHA